MAVSVASVSAQGVAAQRTVTASAANGRPPRPSYSARKQRQSSVSSSAMAGSMSMGSSTWTDVPSSYTIADSPDALKDFSELQSMMDEIQKNIVARQDKISLLTEEVKLLKGRMGMAESRMNSRGWSFDSNGSSQQAGLILSKLQNGDMSAAIGQDASFVEQLLSDKALQSSTASYALAVAAVVFTGGVVAPVVEEKLGLGAAAYYDYIASQDLPVTLAEVDPVTSAVSGGAVGVLTAQLLDEAKARRRSA